MLASGAWPGLRTGALGFAGTQGPAAAWEPLRSELDLAHLLANAALTCWLWDLGPAFQLFLILMVMPAKRLSPEATRGSNREEPEKGSVHRDRGQGPGTPYDSSLAHTSSARCTASLRPALICPGRGNPRLCPLLSLSGDCHPPQRQSCLLSTQH